MTQTESFEAIVESFCFDSANPTIKFDPFSANSGNATISRSDGSQTIGGCSDGSIDDSLIAVSSGHRVPSTAGSTYDGASAAANEVDEGDEKEKTRFDFRSVLPQFFQFLLLFLNITGFICLF